MRRIMPRDNVLRIVQSALSSSSDRRRAGSLTADVQRTRLTQFGVVLGTRSAGSPHR